MFIKLVFQSLFFFLAIDSVWITLVATPWIKKTIPNLLSPNPNMLAAALFYLLYVISLVYLFIEPALSTKLPFSTLITRTFLFGLTAYATYDLTNLAIIHKYTWSLALSDMFWGAILTTITTLIVYKLNI